MIFEKSRIKKILVIKLRAIGDVLLSTVVLPNLRDAFPNVRIDFLCEIAAAGVVQGNPFIDDVIIFDPASEHGASLVRRVRAGNYDLVIDLFGNPRSAIVTLFSGAPYRVGYRFGWRKYCYTIVVEPRGGSVHNTEFNLDALRAIKVPVSESLPFFPLTEESKEFARQFRHAHHLEGSFCVALNAGGGWYTKRWKPEYYAALGKRLQKELRAKIILIWGPGEQSAVEIINREMNHEGILIPPTTLTQLGAILGTCNVFVTNDSGPMHIAAAVGVPVVALFGPTNPSLQGPVGSHAVIVRNEKLDCLECNLTDCPIGNPCMYELSVDDVYRAVKNFIEYLQTSVLQIHG
jgi:lipopolysaccharide heptosyltransferase II